MRKKYFLTLLIFFIFLFLGCNNKVVNEEISDTTSQDIPEKFYNLYTGEESLTDINNNIPFMVMIENSPASRPQSGLSQADVVYETSAEGGIPRFMALFHKNSPDTIGPVRSIRSYFIDISQEHNLPFAHCGGSEEALNEIANNNSIMSINEISKTNYFWRDPKRNPPHNLYTSSTNIRDYIRKNNWTVDGKAFSKFNSSFYTSNDLPTANNVRITMNKLYNTSYTYSNDLYLKSMDGIKAIDADNNEAISFTNIIIQKTNIKLSSDNLHLNIDLLGDGDAIVLSKGKMVSATWKHTLDSSRTRLYDDSGDEIPLSPGKTIWHIVDKSTSVEIN
ncbi:DUF3048 domain-containing protein [Clostridium paraputrificum]|uniref:DUF3048 domain-containing protein n=1 Tax=Clostridium paraputrificum TaxID=29363 RepID=UPI003D335572